MKLRDVYPENIKKPSFTQVVKDYLKSKGITVEMTRDEFEAFDKSGKSIFYRTSNSFFRSAHLESFVNQICKQEGIQNDFKEYYTKIFKA